MSKFNHQRPSIYEVSIFKNGWETRQRILVDHYSEKIQCNDKSFQKL